MMTLRAPLREEDVLLVAIDRFGDFNFRSLVVEVILISEV